MRRITTWLLSTISALVLLFSYHTSTSSQAAATVVAQAPSTAGRSGSTDPGTAAGSGSTSGSSGSSSGSGSSSSATTYTGDAVSTRFGDVQVQITVANGKITKAEVTQVPWSNGRDQEINSYAVPILNSEAVDAQSSTIDMVSGATFTSQGYIGSLQSAIDQANL